MTKHTDCCEKSKKCKTDKDCPEKGWFCTSMKTCVKSHLEHCKERGCGLGDGECDDTDRGKGGSACAKGLTCGSSNCKKFHPDLAAAGFKENSRCCEKEVKTKCQTDSDCEKLKKSKYSDFFFCSSKKTCEKYDAEYCDKNVCGVGDGDCDLDSKKPCGPGLRCGVDNCKQFHEIAGGFLGLFGGFPKSADCCEPMHCERSLKLVGSNPSACKTALQSVSLGLKQKPVQICKAGQFICSAGTSLVTISVGGSTVKCRVRTSGCAKDCSGPHTIPGLIKFEDYKCKWSVGVYG